MNFLNSQEQTHGMEPQVFLIIHMGNARPREVKSLVQSYSQWMQSGIKNPGILAAISATVELTAW